MIKGHNILTYLPTYLLTIIVKKNMKISVEQGRVVISLNIINILYLILFSRNFFPKNTIAKIGCNSFDQSPS